MKKVILVVIALILVAIGIAFSGGMFASPEEPDKPEEPEEPGEQEELPDTTSERMSESTFPHTITGLSGRYTTNSYNPDIREWRDVSGKENDIVIFKGDIKKTSDFVYGGVNDGMKLPTSVLGIDNVYTFFWVARYNGNIVKNIFEGVDNDWLSGFYEGTTAQARHGEWMTDEGGTAGLHAWVQGTDAPNKFRVNGENKVNDATIYGTTSQITVNMGPSGETSDWAIKEMVVYDRLLTLSEIEEVEEYLQSTYFSVMPDGISKAKGFVGNGTRIDDDPRGPPYGWGSMEYCRSQAEQLGFPVWGHVKESGDITESNKCFYYPEGSFDTFEENELDEVNVIGCVTPGREITEGCKEL